MANTDQSSGTASTHLSHIPILSRGTPEYMREIDRLIGHAEEDLKTDYTSGARELANIALKHLAHIADVAACTANDWPEFWAWLVYTAEHLGHARPKMGAAVMSCLLRALERIAIAWNQEADKSKGSTARLASIAGTTIDKILDERKNLRHKLDQLCSLSTLR